MKCDYCKLDHEFGSPAITPCASALRDRLAALEVIAGNMAEVIEYAIGDATFGRIEKAKKVLKYYDAYKSE